MTGGGLRAQTPRTGRGAKMAVLAIELRGSQVQEYLSMACGFGGDGEGVGVFNFGFARAG